MTNSLLLGLAALLPLAVGPPLAQAQSITAQICGGGTIEIPIERDQQPQAPCTTKGCHAGSCRKKFDLAQ
ncbi:hypothetical protein [Erythrobacter sp.]|uniref:hypothetical protein n=1 Tax=Erythrobacter sp. TaxID=1042 RepID=UPI001B0529C3|nr:hypothetical protein [Erythrobacter sp.]MBO6525530.1 hypothetical protein [Erythrobacter sp.]MBO6529797.1 hypothetical protein [Erythrobacter sp.]